MTKIAKYNVNLIFVIIITGIVLIFNSCNENPPNTPNKPVIASCNISGDYNVEFSSKNGTIGSTTIFGKLAPYFGVKATIDGHDYDLTISFYRAGTKDTAALFKLYPNFDSSRTENFAIAGFAIDLNKKSSVSMYSISGDVTLDTLSIGKKINIIKGTYNFIAQSKDSSKTVSIKGMVDLKQNF